MSGGEHILSLLGLALRGGRLAVGDEPTSLAAESGKARLILLAADAGEKTHRRGSHLAEEGHCLLLTLPCSKAELGGALGRGSAAITAVTDLGLAAAVVKKLAILDPERYEEAAQRMDLKLRRAEERKTAPRRQPPPPEKRDCRGRKGPGSAGERRTPPRSEDRRTGRPGEKRPFRDGGTDRYSSTAGGKSGKKSARQGTGKNRYSSAAGGKSGKKSLRRSGETDRYSSPAGGKSDKKSARQGNGKNRYSSTAGGIKKTRLKKSGKPSFPGSGGGH